METKTCKNCGADYHFSWGDNECYNCVKEQHVAAVLSDQEFTGVPVAMANDAFANAYPTEGAEVNFQGYVLKSEWEYKPWLCNMCQVSKKHTVMEHAELIDKFEKTLNAEHPDANKMDNWGFLSSKRCIMCLEQVPHTKKEHYAKVKETDYKNKKTDTSLGQMHGNSIHFSKTNKPVVSEIRPFSWSDKVEVEKRRLKENITSELNNNIVGSDNNDGPAKASGHVQMVYAIDELAQMEKEKNEERWMSMDQWAKTIKKHPEYKQQYWQSVLSNQDQEDLASWYRRSFSSY